MLRSAKSCQVLPVGSGAPWPGCSQNISSSKSSGRAQLDDSADSSDTSDMDFSTGHMASQRTMCWSCPTALSAVGSLSAGPLALLWSSLQLSSLSSCHLHSLVSSESYLKEISARVFLLLFLLFSFCLYHSSMDHQYWMSVLVLSLGVHRRHVLAVDT